MGGLSTNERGAVKEFAGRLRDRFPREIEAIKLYGSKARGTSDAESDIDILVLVKKRTQALDDGLIDIVCDILNETGVFIETVTMTTDSYREAVVHQYPFVINAECDAIQL